MRCLLAAIDFSDVTQRLVAEATRLAGALGAPLYLLHVEAPDPDFVGYEAGPEYIRDAAAHEAMAHHDQLRRLRDQAKETGAEAHAFVIQGPAVEKILLEAERLDAGLIVLGSHGHGALHHLLSGSVAQGVLKRADVPVLVVPSVPGASGR